MMLSEILTNVLMIDSPFWKILLVSGTKKLKFKRFEGPNQVKESTPQKIKPPTHFSNFKMKLDYGMGSILVH